MNVQNEPLYDMACVVKCETPPEWRWKLCEFQNGKRISFGNKFEGVALVAGLNLLPEKVSDSPNFFWEFFFLNSVLLCFFLWAVEWIHEGYHEGL